MIKLATGLGLVLLLTTAACTRSSSRDLNTWQPISDNPGQPNAETEIGAAPRLESEAVDRVVETPTPNPPIALPPLREDVEQYVVQPGDTLNQIALAYNVTTEQITAANSLVNPNLLEIGQVLLIPAPRPLPVGSSFKIIPDSELVYGPISAYFDTEDFILRSRGYLSVYREEIVDGRWLTGAQIVARVAENYSVNPRLLLAVLEHQSSWVTNPNPDITTQDYPLGLLDSNRKGLYRQLAWTADNLNRGYYTWRVGGSPAWTLQDGSLVPVSPIINAGTAGIQYLFAQLTGYEAWNQAVGHEGLFSTFQAMFGFPFSLSFDPLIPAGLEQPDLQLPFEPGKSWSFTGGPHGGWDSGSAWAALDFAPPGDALGCVQSDEWVTAVADGLIVHSNEGAVVQDLDGDGLAQTGWSILYMHVETRDRIPAGTEVKAGDRIGHPSCEGGFSTGTHLHIARRYNGEWISADQPDTPFVMDGWVSSGDGNLYDGVLTRDSEVVIADNGRTEENQIER
jgi:murein DD-endopeptidase MepM/ murein hydrolase activator NlpD